MKKKFFKLITITIVISMLIIILSGCNSGNNSSSSTNETEKQSANENGGNNKERVKLTYLTSVNVDTEGYDVNDNPYVKYIEEKNNVDLELISEAANYPTKVNTVMASGQLPDFVLLNYNNKADLTKFAKEGLLMPLDEYLKNAPNLNKNISKVAWDLTKVDNKIYAIPFERYDKTPYLTFVRKDWIQNLGIDIEKVKTIDDWYAMLKDFVEKDPDKNGKKDTYGIVADNAGITRLSMFLDSFDAAKTKYIDGEVRPYYIQDTYKEWLKFMNKLYNEGILDPEYVVTTGQMLWDKVMSGKYGMFLTFWSMQEILSKGGSRDAFIALKPPLKEDGSEAKYLYGAPIRHYIAVTKDCKYPDRVVQLMDWAASEEGGIFVHAGLEGLDWDKKDGKIVIREDRKGKNWAWRFITLGIQNPVIQGPLEDVLRQTWGDLGIQELKMSDETGMYDDILLQAPYFEELADYDFTKIVDEFRNKAIMGQINIDAEWDKYVSDWRKAGGDRWIRLYTDWYNKEYKK